MKVDFNIGSSKLNRGLNFEGYKPVKSDKGFREYEFNYVYDDSQKDCYLEVFELAQDENGNYYVTGEKDNDGNVKPLPNYDLIFENPDEVEMGYKLKSGQATKINLSSAYGLAQDQPFAYHYKLYPKGQKGGIPEYKIDAGNIINNIYSTGKGHEIYNFVTKNVSTGTNNGSMKLIVPDFNNVAWVYDENNNIVPNPELERAKKTNKTPVNKIGGSLAGIEKDLDDGKLDKFKKVITTPLFTDDSLTAHAYWNKNNFQMAHSLGNINNYISIQKKLFAKGINLVSDGAYVNEGLEGVHFRHVLKWGEKSPYFDWFKISGLKDSPLSMGVFGKKTNHVTHRIVNSKYNFEQKSDGSVKITSNSKYKSNKPTYIQIFDDRLVNFDKLNGEELIRAYDKLTDTNLEINNHNDSVVPYSFRINPETYKKNVEALNKFNKSVDKNKQIDLKSGLGTRAVTQFEYFGLDGKHESGFETWDANADIAKLNFVSSHSETMELKNLTTPEERAERKAYIKQKNIEVQDYAISSAKYWTKKTSDILNLNVAQHLKNIENKSADEIYSQIKYLSNGKVFPKELDINKKVVKNVLKDRYNISESRTEDNFKKAILQGLMEVPLDSIEVGDDIVSVLASPFITKRATEEKYIGLSRYDMYKNGNKHLTQEYAKAYKLTDLMYEREMSSLAENIIEDIEKKLPNDKKLHDKNGNTTPYGKFVIPILTSEIARFAIIKSVSPNAKFSWDKATGELSYDYNELKDNTSLIGIGVFADSPEDEAISLIKKLRNNISSIKKDDKENLSKALLQTIKGTDINSFKLAQVIVDRSQAGLDWRIDATKDITDVEAIRRHKMDFKETWDDIIAFWSKFTTAVKEYHPDAYIAAEITDEGDIFNKGNGHKANPRFSSSKEAVKKLINEAGFTTIANYTYFSSGINQIFGKLFDFDGNSSPDKGLSQGETVANQLNSFLTSGPLESIIYSYIFSGNHDKCRALDGYAIDTDMVYTDLTDSNNYEYRLRAYKILNATPYGKEPNSDSVNNYDFSRVSPLGIAKCEAISSGMGKAVHKIGLSEERSKYLYGAMLDALKNISNSSYRGRVIEFEGFGYKDFPTAIDIVLDEMQYIGADSYECMTDSEREILRKKSLQFIIDPAMSKLLGHTKFLTAITGNPTLFSGDEYGATGFEFTTKNITVNDRNVNHEEWVDKNSSEYMEFVDKFKENMEYQFDLRNRSELEPLNNGAPFVLKPQNAKFKKKVYENNFEDRIKSWEEGNTKVSALLRQSPNGKMTVSVFNTEGLTHKSDEYYRPAEIVMPCIDLNEAWGDEQMRPSKIKSGLKFRNADKNDTTIYYTNDKNQITGPNKSPIKFNDSTLILYHDPSFTGKKVLYNPQYNFVSKPYANNYKQEIVLGKNLELVSK